MHQKLLLARSKTRLAVCLCFLLLLDYLEYTESYQKTTLSSSERKYPGCTAWPAYPITKAEFTSSNGSIPAGWKARWEENENGPYPYSVTTAVHALLELKALVVDDPWGYTKGWGPGKHPCNFAQVLCNQHGVVTGVDLAGMAPSVPAFVRKRSLEKPEGDSSVAAGKLRGSLAHRDGKAGSTFIRETYESSTANLPTLRLSMLPDGRRWQELGLMSLTTMRFDNARIDTAKLPDTWGGYPLLKEVSLSGSGLFGTLPRSWGRLARVKRIDLSDNALVGALPPEWSGMESLEELDLSLSGRGMFKDRLSGDLPPDWQFLLKLKTLDLWNQGISGSLPASWGTLPALEVVSFSGTEISGTLPDAWSNLTNITSIQLAETKISGQLPESWGRLLNLTWFDARGTQVARAVPKSWKSFCYGKTATGIFPSFAYLPWNVRSLFYSRTFKQGTLNIWNSLLSKILSM